MRRPPETIPCVRAVRHIGNRVVVSGRAVQRGVRVGLIHLADSEWLDVVR